MRAHRSAEIAGTYWRLCCYFRQDRKSARRRHAPHHNHSARLTWHVPSLPITEGMVASWCTVLDDIDALQNHCGADATPRDRHVARAQRQQGRQLFVNCSSSLNSPPDWALIRPVRGTARTRDEHGQPGHPCGCSSMVEQQLPKVRHPLDVTSHHSLN